MKSAISENDARSSLDAMWLAYRRAVAAGAGTHLKTLVSPHVVALVLYYRIARGNAECGEGVEVAATTTYGYDNNGNVISVGTTTTYAYDFDNHLIQSVINGATTTYTYDPFGNRMSQVSSSSTTIYPNKYYSLSWTGTSTPSSATSTDYLYDGDTLLSQRVTPGATTTVTMYQDSLTSGWNNWSSGSTQNFSATTSYSGKYSIAATYTTAWGSLYLENPGFSSASSTYLQFAFMSPVAAPNIQVIAYGAGGIQHNAGVRVNPYIPGGTINANTWYLVDIPLSDLNDVASTTTGFIFQDGATTTLYFDAITLVGNGSSTVSYIHPDNLGSTNVTSDATGKLVQLMNYAPYGSVLSSTNFGPTPSSRQYIGQIYDANSGLSYLNARYYNGTQGQFTSQDPVFLGQPKQQNLQDPQSLNSYSYSVDNPITKEDPTGKQFCEFGCLDDVAIVAVLIVETEGPSIENDLSTAVSTAPEVESAAPGVTNFYDNFPDPSTFKEYQEVPGWPSEVADETALQYWRTEGVFKWGSIAFLGGTAFGDLANEAMEYEIKTLEAQNGQSEANTSNSNTYSQTYSQSGKVFANIQNSSTVQSRSTAVSSYNTASGASSPQNQLWVTPSGAVVTWGGTVVAGPVSNNK